jgi:hypothetical protein
MKQLEIEYFWPLTEQIPLDLDFNGCYNRTVLSTSIPSNILTGITIAPAWTNTSFRMQENNTTMLMAKKPNFIRKLIYKLLNSANFQNCIMEELSLNRQ